MATPYSSVNAIPRPVVRYQTTSANCARALSYDTLARLSVLDALAAPRRTHLNFSWLMTDDEADFIIDSVLELADLAPTLSQRYRCDPATARFKLRSAAV